MLTKGTSFNASLRYHLHKELRTILDHVQIITMQTLGGAQLPIILVLY